MSGVKQDAGEQVLNGIGPHLPQWPHFGEDERAAVDRVLRSGRVNYWTGGEGAAFEHEFAAFVGTEHAVAVANGTVALELALHAFSIGAGDEVITTPRTFMASASAIILRGARPVFADVDPASGNITAESIRARLTDRTRAVIVVHLAGWPAEMDAIMELARERDLIVIEDCAQAHGAVHRGRRVGSIGHAGAFSFCQDKIMTTAGEGGMLTLNDEAAWKRAWAYKEHGKDYDAVHTPPDRPGYRPIYHSFGTNWRLSEVQAAVGRVQLRKLPGWLETRARNARLFIEGLASITGLDFPVPAEGLEHAYYKLYAYVDQDRLAPGWSRDRILAEATALGVPLFSGSASEIYLEKAFTNLGLDQAVLPEARSMGQESLMFVVHPTLAEEHVKWMIARLRPLLEGALSGSIPLPAGVPPYTRLQQRP